METNYTIIHVLDAVDSIGEDLVETLLSVFSCQYNRESCNTEVEHFLRVNAIEFTRRKMSITYLVLNDNGEVVGFFTLTHKPIIVKNDKLTKSAKRKMEKHAKYDAELDAYSVSAFLIAQFGKNYTLPKEKRISGIKLMELTLDTIKDIQKQIGGGIVFLECEKPRSGKMQKLIEFYQLDSHKFNIFGERHAEKDDVDYIQMLKFL